MTMKLINILNEDSITQEKIVNGLTGLEIPFEYGTVMFKNIEHETNVITIYIFLNKFGSDMFDKAYLTFSQKIQSLSDDQYNSSYIKLKVDDVRLKMGDASIHLSNYLSVSTKNTLRYDKPSVEKILKGGYHVEVNMDLLPNITDDTYDIIEKKKEHGKSVFEFLEDGTLSNGTSYKLILRDLWIGHVHQESSGGHLDYSDFYVNLLIKVDKDFPLTDEEKNEIEKMFKMYDVDIVILKT